MHAALSATSGDPDGVTMTAAEAAAFDARFRAWIERHVIGDDPPPLDAAGIEVIRRTVAAAPLDDLAVLDTAGSPAAA